MKENEQSLAANEKFLLGFIFCGLSFGPKHERLILTEAWNETPVNVALTTKEVKPMLPYSGIRSRSLKRLFIYLFLITPAFLFALHIDMHSGGSIDLSLARAQTSEGSAEQETPPSEDPNEPLPQEPEPEPPAPESAELPSPSEVEMTFIPSVTAEVDDFTGTLHLKYPIEVPPGRANLAPKLILDYNSSAKNGWIGVGWDIPIGFIQRSGPRWAVPKYDATDIFYVSLGDRSLRELVSIGSNEYRLKIEGPFYRIIFNSTGNYWEVTDKRGTKMRFGYSAASRIGTVKDPSTSTETYRWFLDRVWDVDSNYMEILYWRHQDSTKTFQIYPQEIKYTGQTGLLPNHRIIFNLTTSDRADPIYNFRGGFQMRTRRRLKSIEVKTNDALVRKYELGYTVNTLSRMTSITVYGSNGTSTLPPTDFVHSGYSDGFGTSINWHNPSVWEAAEDFSLGNYLKDADTWGNITDVIDLDGDGFPDRVRKDLSSPYDTWNIFKGNGATGFGSAQNWPNQSRNYMLNHNPSERSINYEMIDMNGDGLPDMVDKDYSSPYDTWKVCLNNGSGFDSCVNWSNKSAWDAVNGNCIRNTDDDIPYDGTYTAVIDMNGDGLPDRVRYDKSSPYDTWKVYFSNGQGFAETGTDWPLNYTAPNIYENYIQKLINGSSAKDLIDMNGDGLPDWIFYDSTSPYDTWVVRFSNGTGFDVAKSWPNPSGVNYIRQYSEGYGVHADVIDVNGDGLPDRVVQSGTGWYVYPNNGSGFGSGVYWSNGCYESPEQAQIRGIDASGTYSDLKDMDGDGLLDMLIYDRDFYPGGGQTYSTWNVCKNNGPFPNLLKRVENGIGGTIRVTYEPSSTYTNDHLPFVVQTVASLEIDDGNGTVSTTNYTYGQGYFDPTDREFRGFGFTKKTKPDDTFISTWRYTGWDTEPDCYKGLIYKQWTKDSSENKYLEIENTHASTTPYTGVCFPYLQQRFEEVYDGEATARCSAASFDYDAYGNTTRRYSHGEVDCETGQELTQAEKDENWDYSPYDTTNWIVSLPKWVYVKDYAQAMKAQTWYTYYAGKTRVETRKRWVDGVNDPTDSYIYDTNFNLWKIYDPNGNPPTVITYDTSTKTYPYQITNPKNQVTTLTFNPGLGRVLTWQDPNVAITTYTYDPFGRLTKITKPYDESSTYGTVGYSYENIGTVGSQKIVTRATEDAGTGNHLWKETYFDGLGRTFKTRAEGPDGKVIVTKTQYNLRGLVSDVSLPYFESIETPKWKSFSYDPMERLKEIDYPDGTQVTMTHVKGATTIIDQNGHKKVEKKDVFGRLVTVEEYSGTSPNFTLYATTLYEHSVLDDLEHIQDAFGNHFRFGYDPMSRKVWMEDPDMGRWDYEYDRNSNLRKQWDARRPKTTFPNNPIEFTPDELNRVDFKDYHDPGTPNIDYVYDEPTSTNGIGRLTMVNDASGTTNLFYDKRGRTTKTTTTVDLVPYIIETTYDSLDRVRSIKYPDNESVTYTYDAAGNTSIITGYLIYSGYNALGQPGTLTYGNSVITTRQYYPLNYRLQEITTSGQLQDLSYGYDNKGNITSITDAINGTRSQSFTYDHLDRLTQAQSGSYGTITYEYNQIGNMTYNSQVGYYTYGTKPHAVIQAGTNSYTYDENGNMDSGPARTIINNWDNQPSSIIYNGTTTFYYDYQSQRVKKQTSSGTTVYIGKLYECTNGTCTKHVFGGNKRIVLSAPLKEVRSFEVNAKNTTLESDSTPTRELKVYGVSLSAKGVTLEENIYTLETIESEKRVALKNPSTICGSTTLYYHTDHLGSSNVITNTSAQNVEEVHYYPYGSTRVQTGGDCINHKFTGQEEDGETGWYYYGARYYDPALGRFTSADLIIPDLTNPQALNRYTYVLNNPLRYIDPSGNLEFDSDYGGNDTPSEARAAGGYYDQNEALSYGEIHALVRDHNLSKQSDALVECMAWKESSFNPNAKHKSKTETGLMAITKGAAKDAGYDHNLMVDPAKNIETGTKYLDICISRAKGDLAIGLDKYGGVEGYSTNVIDCANCMSTNPKNPYDCFTKIHP